jgi:hypothetical protein
MKTGHLVALGFAVVPPSASSFALGWAWVVENGVGLQAVCALVALVPAVAVAIFAVAAWVSAKQTGKSTEQIAHFSEQIADVGKQVVEVSKRIADVIENQKRTEAIGERNDEFPMNSPHLVVGRNPRPYFDNPPLGRFYVLSKENKDLPKDVMANELISLSISNIGKPEGKIFAPWIETADSIDYAKIYNNLPVGDSPISPLTYRYDPTRLGEVMDVFVEFKSSVDGKNYQQTYLTKHGYAWLVYFGTKVLP